MRILTLIEASERLRCMPRRLREFLRAHPIGLDGRPLYLQYGREKLFTEADIARISDLICHLTEQDLSCRSNSGRRVPARRRITRSAAPTSESQLSEALRLASERSPRRSSNNENVKSNVVSLSSAANSRLPAQRRPT